MKNIYSLLLVSFAAQLTHAQTLTRLNNEPVVGDIHAQMAYDTVSAIPKNTGANQLWNFSSLVPVNGSATTSTYVAMSSVPASATVQGATLAEEDGQGDYTFYKSTASPAQFELAGNYSGGTPSAKTTFSNTAVMYTWPLTFNSTHTDTYAGNLAGTGFAANMTGNATVTATGSGSITLPGGVTYSNILQVTTIRNSTVHITSPTSLTLKDLNYQYDYFEPSQKFPLLTVTIDVSDDGMGGLDTSITISGNTIITVGINNRNFDAQYAIYPNPAKDSFSIKLSNAGNENCAVEIFNAMGQAVKSANLGTASAIDEKVSLSGLSTGVYVVKTTLGNKTSTRRLIVE